MTTETAQIVLYVIAAVGLIVWLIGFKFLTAAQRVGRRTRAETSEQFQVEQPIPENLVVGTAEVAGSPEALSAKTAAVLAKQSMGPLGQLKIVEQLPDRVRFEWIHGVAGQARAASPFPWNGARRGEVRFTPLRQERARVDYAIEVTDRNWLLTLGWVFQSLGLIALVTGFAVIHLFVLDHHSPAIRGQAIQMMQASHFLWPPFLFGALYRRSRTAIQASFDALVHNLPYHAN